MYQGYVVSEDMDAFQPTKKRRQPKGIGIVMIEGGVKDGER